MVFAIFMWKQIYSSKTSIHHSGLLTSSIIIHFSPRQKFCNQSIELSSGFFYQRKVLSSSNLRLFPTATESHISMLCEKKVSFRKTFFTVSKWNSCLCNSSSSENINIFSYRQILLCAFSIFTYTPISNSKQRKFSGPQFPSSNKHQFSFNNFAKNSSTSTCVTFFS